jgi:putative hemolysin
MREDRGIVSTASGLCKKTGVLLTQRLVYARRQGYCLHSVLSMREDRGIVSTASCLCEKTGVLLAQRLVYARRQGYC